MLIINHARYAAGYQRLPDSSDEEELAENELYFDSWSVALDAIPTEKLWPSYKQGIRCHSSSWMITTGDILRAYYQLQSVKPIDTASIQADLWDAELREQIGEDEFSLLDVAEQVRLVDAKIAELLRSSKAQVYRRMPIERFREHAKEQVKKDLANQHLQAAAGDEALEYAH